MDIQEIRKLGEAYPFKPFNLVLNDGRRRPRDDRAVGPLGLDFPPHPQPDRFARRRIPRPDPDWDLGTRGQDNHLYKVTFSRLGDNLLTIHYGAKKYAVLEFIVTEPLETLTKKRSSFLVSHQQHRDPSRWYNGLFSDWDQRNKVCGVSTTPMA